MKIILITLILITLLCLLLCMMFMTYLIQIRPQRNIPEPIQENIKESISQKEIDEDFEKSVMAEFNKTLENINAILTDQEEVVENEQTK